MYCVFIHVCVCFYVFIQNLKLRCTYQEYLTAGKFGKFGESSVIFQTKAIKLLLIINILMLVCMYVSVYPGTHVMYSLFSAVPTNKTVQEALKKKH